MRAEVRHIISNDFFDEATWRPEVEDTFSFWISISVGPQGDIGEEQFQAQVCTPKWLMANHAKEEVVIGWQRILVMEYDWSRIEQAVQQWVASWSADDWHTLALHIARLGPWEFDNYVP